MTVNGYLPWDAGSGRFSLATKCMVVLLPRGKCKAEKHNKQLLTDAEMYYNHDKIQLKTISCFVGCDDHIFVCDIPWVSEFPSGNATEAWQCLWHKEYIVTS